MNNASKKFNDQKSSRNGFESSTTQALETKKNTEKNGKLMKNKNVSVQSSLFVPKKNDSQRRPVVYNVKDSKSGAPYAGLAHSRVSFNKRKHSRDERKNSGDQRKNSNEQRGDSNDRKNSNEQRRDSNDRRDSNEQRRNSNDRKNSNEQRRDSNDRRNSNEQRRYSNDRRDSNDRKESNEQRRDSNDRKNSKPQNKPGSSSTPVLKSPRRIYSVLQTSKEQLEGHHNACHVKPAKEEQNQCAPKPKTKPKEYDQKKPRKTSKDASCDTKDLGRLSREEEEKQPRRNSKDESCEKKCPQDTIKIKDESTQVEPKQSNCKIPPKKSIKEKNCNAAPDKNEETCWRRKKGKFTRLPKKKIKKIDMGCKPEVKCPSKEEPEKDDKKCKAKKS